NELELALYIFANGITDDIMGLEKMKVIGIMKDKMERFNQDEELRMAAYNRELNIQAKNSEMKANYLRGKEEGIEIGKELGKKDEIKNLTLQLFKIKYPDEDIDILANLEVGEYELIFKMLASDQPLEEILAMIK